MRTVHVLVTGRVQGVGYRAWVQDQALSADLDGWVRNRHDGAVEAVLSGEDAAVADLLEALWNGPRLAAVTNVALTAHLDPVDGGFAVLPTV